MATKKKKASKAELEKTGRNSTAGKKSAAKTTRAAGHGATSAKKSVAERRSIANKKTTSVQNSVRAAGQQVTTAKPSGAEKRSAVNKKTVSTKNSSREINPFDEKLKVITPSGAKEASFFELVFDVARQVPKGRVTSYGAIAAAIGARGSARQVGWAMHAAGSAKPKVPAHRIVNSAGILSGKHHFNPPGKMEALLAKEGIQVKNDKIVDFKKHFWDPSEEF